MTSHLSSEHFCRWIAGDRGESEARHLRECPACQAELEQFQSALAAFNHSLEQCPAPPIRLGRVPQTLPRWIMATAALSLIVAAPVYWSARQQRDLEQAKTDQLLLERVHAGLSRTVPASMEPLMELITTENAK
jgi:hypothetical protein